MARSSLTKLLSKLVPPAVDEKKKASIDGALQNTAPKRNLETYTYLSLAAGAFCIIIFALSGPDGESFLRLGASLALALGAVILGALLGFLFGIPRTLQHDTETEEIAYQINTNLEQISDWLTKIIVGVGLIELSRIVGWLMQFSKQAGAGFGAEFGQTFVLSVIVYFVCMGFLFGYLWTRLYFGLAIKTADQGLVARRLEKYEEEARSNSKALLLVTRQLSTGYGEELSVPQQELDEAIASATTSTKIEIFYKAATARKSKETIDQAITIFRSLIAADKLEKYHRNFGELGFALTDKPKPDWEAAETVLKKAISIRDSVGDIDYGGYEFVLARCQIHLRRPKEDILQNFKKAAEDTWVQTWSWAFDSSVNDWCKQNGVTREELGFK